MTRLVRNLQSSASIRQHLLSLGLNQEERAYVEMMLPRYRVALDLVEKLLARRLAEGVAREELALVDVAPHLLSELFAAAFCLKVHTIGVAYRDLPRNPHGGSHLPLDLNETHKHEGWVGFHQGDVVFLGEILEHLHACPRMVLGCASRWVKEGGFLVIQTPNAVALDRRWHMLLGHHPYEMIRAGDDPGHFRESTAAELLSMGAYWQLVPVDLRFANYFHLPHRRGPPAWLYAGLSWLFKGLRDGITLVFQKVPGTPDPRAKSRRIRGCVEGFKTTDKSLLVQGWAVDVEEPGPVALVELVHRGLTFFGQAPGEERPDVVKALGGEQRLLRCGFKMTAPLPGGFDPNQLVAVTRDHFGDWYELPGSPAGASNQPRPRTT